LLFHISVIKNVNYPSASFSFSPGKAYDDKVNSPDGGSSNPSKLIKRL
jgi:hypothetical protein